MAGYRPTVKGYSKSLFTSPRVLAGRRPMGAYTEKGHGRDSPGHTLTN